MSSSSSQQRPPPHPALQRFNSPSIRKGTEDILQYINSLLVERDSKKPVLVETSTQTDGKEVEELKNKVITLQNMNFTLQERMAKMEEGYLAKIAVLTEENNRLKEAQEMSNKLVPSTAEKEETPMTVAPAETYSEHSHPASYTSNLTHVDVELTDLLSLDDEADTTPIMMSIDDETNENFQDTVMEFIDPSYLSFTSSPEHTQHESFPTPHNLPTTFPVSSPAAPHHATPLHSSPPQLSSPSPLRIFLRTMPMALHSPDSEYSDSDDEATGGMASDQEIHDESQSLTRGHSLDGASPMEDIALEAGGLPFPSRFITAVTCTRQIRLAVSPPHSNEDSIFYVNRPVSPDSDSQSDDTGVN